MIDLYLRFDDREQALAALHPLGMVHDDDMITTSSHDYALCEVGEIPGRDGWHINLRVVNPAFDVSALQLFCVQPREPFRIWA